MGAGQSETQKLESKITHLHDHLVYLYKHLRNVKATQGFFDFFFVFFILMFFVYFLLRVYLIRDNSWVDISHSLIKHELLYSMIILTLWSLIKSAFPIATFRTTEDIETTRFQMAKSIAIYETKMNLPAIRKALEDAGHGAQLQTFSISASDFGVNDQFGEKNYLYMRIWNAIMGDGPDRRYAVICPNCKQHNGIIDESEIPKLKYKCPHCQKTVTYTEVVIKKAKPKEEMPDLTLDDVNL